MGRKIGIVKTKAGQITFTLPSAIGDAMHVEDKTVGEISIKNEDEIIVKFMR